jgi:hypothetical protein
MVEMGCQPDNTRPQTIIRPDYAAQQHIHDLLNAMTTASGNIVPDPDLRLSTKA